MHPTPPEIQCQGSASEPRPHRLSLMGELASMNNEHAIVFAVGDREQCKYGYTTLIEWSTTSFYIKPQFRQLQTFKISIHNPDPKHPGKDGFRFDFDHDEPKRKAVAAGGGWKFDGAQPPLWFPGRRVNPRVLHLARFAVSWDMFAKQVPSAPPPQFKQKATLHALLQRPALLRASHVDIYMSEGEPYWPDEANVRANNAGMGPIVNESGMSLTAVDRRVSTINQPDPYRRSLDAGVPIADCVRGVAAQVDPSGFLWICEKLMPKDELWQQS